MIRSSLLLLLVSLIVIANAETRLEAAIKRIAKLPSKPMKVGATPANFTWGNVNGVNYLTVVRNQNVPYFCDGGWAFAVTSTLSDRIKIARNAAWPDINLAPQVLLSCSMNSNTEGCNGGFGADAWDFIQDKFITDETCQLYSGRGRNNGNGCSNITLCKNCDPHEPCYIPPAYRTYNVLAYTNLQGFTVQAVMNEIYENGPIVCTVQVSTAFQNYNGGILNATGSVLTGQYQDVSIVGFGEDAQGNGYWIGRNSWGTFWGESGYFKVYHADSSSVVLQTCTSGVPADTWTNPVWHNTTQAEQNDPANNKTNGPYPQSSAAAAPRYHNGVKLAKKTCKHMGSGFKFGELIKTPRPHEYLDYRAVPAVWDWRNISGRNYLSWTVNQHIPEYCGSCWAQATTSALADRFNIISNGTLPQVALNPQVIINCNAGGSCNGGDPAGVYSFAHKSGIPDNTCNQYVAANPAKVSCTGVSVCQTCTGPDPSAPLDPGNCSAVTNFRRYWASEYGSVRGAKQMKAEIYQRGPIACGIMATAKLENNYTGGIFEQFEPFPQINHEISVVGWGNLNGEEYWIVRNSWGTYWGLQGFFYIKMYSNNLGIETDCIYAVPSTTKTSTDDEFLQVEY